MNNLITEKYSVNLLPQMEIVNNEISDSFPGFIENFLVKHLEDTNNDELNNLTNFNEEEHISDIGEITIPISVELFQEPLQVNLIDVPLICDDNNLSTKISPTTTNCVKKSNLNDKNHNVYLCFKCYEEFHSLGLFREHLKSHKTEKTFKCPKCSTGFNLENNFKIHLIIEHFNNNLLEDNICCPICRVTFQRKASLKSHVLIHQIEELFLCELCQGEYENEDELFKHMETHASVCNKEQNKFPQEETSLICSQCKVEAENFEEYKMHIEKHAEIKRIILKGKRKGKTKKLKTYSNNSSSSSGTWKCKFCSRTFSKASLLHRHERIHTGEKPFKCQLCSRAFAQMGSLRIHLDKHSGFKPYECSLCSAKFTQKGNLRAHVEKTHTAPKEATQQIYKCSQCTCIFKKISSLNGHVTKVHINENFGPPTRSDLVLNSLSFMENSNGKSALFKSTNNKCNNANLNVEENFIKLTENHENDGLRRYTVYQKKIDDIRWYFCVYCTSKFKKPSDLIRHFRTHTLEKPFKCLQCNQSFSLKSTLTSHKKIHERCSNNENNSNKILELFKSSKNDVAPLIEPILKEPALNNNNNNNKSSLLLNNNEKILLLERPHHCKICNARFTRIMSLKRHMLHHSGEKKFKCLICPKAFVTKYSLKEHMNYHQNIKNYHCTICAKKFVTSSLLKRHQFIHSNNAKKSSISCTQCGKLLKTSALLKNHMKKIHPEVNERNDETTTEIFQEINAAEEIPQIQQVYFNLNNDEEILTLPAIFNQQQQEIIVNSHQGIVENSENVDLSIENGVALNLNDIPINLIDAGTNINNNNNNNNNSVEIPLDAQVICINCHKMFSDYLLFEKHNCYYGEEIMENENFNIYLNQAAENPENFQADDDDDDEKKKFACFQCNFSTVDEESFRKHLLIHPAEKMCKFCGKFFKKMCDLTRHIRTHTGEKPFECETCQRKFSLKSTLESHLKTHNAAGRALKFGCKVCSSNFASKSSLKLHQSLHTGEKPYKCRICTDTFRTSAIRKSHEKLHENSTETFIVMDPSGVNWLNLAAAAENQDLLENYTDIPVLHVTTGTNDDDDDQRLFVEEEEVPKKKFQCDICAKFYSSKDVLRKHKKALHGQNRKFPCIKCDKVFYQLEDVNKHIGEFHSGNRPYSCQFCANSFGEERGLKTHIKRLHSQQKVEEEETTTTTTNNALFLGLEKDAFFSN